VIFDYLLEAMMAWELVLIYILLRASCSTAGTSPLSEGGAAHGLGCAPADHTVRSARYGLAAG